MNFEYRLYYTRTIRYDISIYNLNPIPFFFWISESNQKEWYSCTHREHKCKVQHIRTGSVTSLALVEPTTN